MESGNARVNRGYGYVSIYGVLWTLLTWTVLWNYIQPQPDRHMSVEHFSDEIEIQDHQIAEIRVTAIVTPSQPFDVRNGGAIPTDMPSSHILRTLAVEHMHNDNQRRPVLDGQAHSHNIAPVDNLLSGVHLASSGGAANTMCGNEMSKRPPSPVSSVFADMAAVHSEPLQHGVDELHVDSVNVTAAGVLAAPDQRVTKLTDRLEKSYHHPTLTAALKFAFFKLINTPPLLATLVGIVVGLIGPVKDLFFVSGDVYGSAVKAPLGFVTNICRVIGAASIPVNMLVLGSNLMRSTFLPQGCC